ncbi:hypothetical protein OAU26_03690 [Mariniblastus sp.]|nr:hypothetical protein [Mariniblastus sp.]
MNSSFIVLNCLTLLFASFSLPLASWAGEGWAIKLHSAHFVFDGYLLISSFMPSFPRQIVFIVVGGSLVVDGISAFLGGVVLFRCLSNETGACFERFPQSFLALCVGFFLVLFGVFKMWSLRFTPPPPTAAQIDKRHVVVHLLTIMPYILYVLVFAAHPSVLGFFPCLRIGFTIFCLASRWGDGQTDISVEKWSAVCGLIFSAISALNVNIDDVYANEQRVVCLWLFVVLDSIQTALLTRGEKSETDEL